MGLVRGEGGGHLHLPSYQQDRAGALFFFVVVFFRFFSLTLCLSHCTLLRATGRQSGPTGGGCRGFGRDPLVSRSRSGGKQHMWHTLQERTDCSESARLRLGSKCFG